MTVDTAKKSAKEEILILLNSDLREPLFPDQRVVATIGCPGSGKSTLSLENDPKEWITLTLDDFRTAMWPPHRGVYWDIRATERGSDAQRLLHQTYIHALKTSLLSGWNIFLADTHVKPEAFVDTVRNVQALGKRVSWKLFETPVDIILERNKTRQSDHRLPDDILKAIYETMWDENAWWRSIPYQAS